MGRSGRPGHRLHPGLARRFDHRPVAVALLLFLLSSITPAQKAVVEGQGVEDLGHALLVLDLDGDKKDEIVAGAPRFTLERRHYVGRVLLVRGSSGDVPGRTVTWVGSDSGSHFGSALAAGDVNGDGAPDLLVGAPGAQGSRGAAHLFLGGKGGGAILSGGDLAQSAVSLLLEGTEELGAFGRAVAAGDLDGDGLAEIVVAAPMAGTEGTPQAGRVYVFHGRRKWKATKAAIGEEEWKPDLVVIGREREGLGHVLLTADLDADGIQELVMASPWYHGEAGSVVVLKGRRDLLSSPRTLVLDKDDPDLVARGNVKGRLGEALAAADVDGDGRTELLVGEPRRRTGGSEQAGAVHAISFHPEDRRLDLGRKETLAHVTSLHGQVAFEQMGGALWAGRASGEAKPDLLVGSPAIGRVAFFLDVAGFGSDLRPSRGLMPGGSGAKGFGASVAAGDLDGDGEADLVIAAPGANRLFVY